jgi:PAS domain S-box-containing protein
MTERLAQYFEELPIYVTVQDRDLRIVQSNRLFRADFGELIGEYCYAAYKAINRPCPDCPVAKTFTDGAGHRNEQRIVTRLGEELPVMVHTSPIRDATGELVGVLEAHTEIRGVKRSKKIQQLRERYARFFEEVPCQIAILGPSLVIEQANRRFRSTYGAGAGTPCYKTYKHREEPCLDCPALLTFADGQVREHEDVTVTASGEKINVLATIAPVYDQEGNG